MLRHAFLILFLSVSARADFVLTGAMTTGRSAPHATLLSDGRVLITDDGISTEVYLPASGKFRQTNTQMPGRFDGHAATLLNDGRVLISGGGYTVDPGSTTYGGKHALLFDPAAETFTPTGDLNEPRQNHTATRLADGRVLIIGGTLDVISGFTGSRTPVESVEIYDPATGTFRKIAATQSRSGHAATRLADGRVLIVGGATSTGQADAVIFDPKTETFSPAGSLPVSPTNPIVILLRDGRVLVLGRDLFQPEIYDPSTNSFRSAGQIDPRHDYIAATLGDGRVLIGGGQSYNDPMPLLSATIFDPSTNRFNDTTWMHFAHVKGTAVTMLDGSVLIVGGHDNGPPDQAVAELYLNRPPPRRHTVR